METRLPPNAAISIECTRNHEEETIDGCLTLAEIRGADDAMRAVAVAFDPCVARPLGLAGAHDVRADVLDWERDIPLASFGFRRDADTTACDVMRAAAAEWTTFRVMDEFVLLAMYTDVQHRGAIEIALYTSCSWPETCKLTDAELAALPNAEVVDVACDECGAELGLAPPSRPGRHVFCERCWAGISRASADLN